MKIILALTLLFAVFALPSFAGRDNVVVTFSTKGPDVYADGTTVLDGERYALVWTPQGETFGGFASDGTAVAPSKVAMTAPLAKDGCCPQTKFEIDETYARTNYPGGTWGVYLLDTRRYAVDGNGMILKGADGLPVVASLGDGTVLNGYGEVAANLTGGLSEAVARKTLVSNLGCAIPESGKNVRISGIEIVNGQVKLSVSDTLPCLRYRVMTGETPDRMGAAEGDPECYGRSGGDLEIVLPGEASCGFFAIEGK